MSSTIKSNNNEEPAIISDTRFRGGRELVKNANYDAIEIFATLLQESIHKYGETSIESASCYYEYGNALFRTASRIKNNDNETATTKKDMKNKIESSSSKVETNTKSPSQKKILATAASNRNNNKLFSQNSSMSNAKNEKKGYDEDTSEDDDIQLSLELMESAWAILDEYYNTTTPTKLKYKSWVEDQLPRYLIGIGDILSIQERHADAVDAYTRALPYRESAVTVYANCPKTEKTLNYLRSRRLYVEVNVLIAEELLACGDDDGDIITRETNSVLVRGEERIDFIQGYYDKARDELQETVYLMGRIASSGNKDFGKEKEDICFLSTMLMSVGNTLADLLESKGNSNHISTSEEKPSPKRKKV